MAGHPKLGQGLLLAAVLCNVVLPAASLLPLSDADKDTAKGLFVPREDGSFGSLEEAYQGVRALQALKIADYDTSKISNLIIDSLKSCSLSGKDVFYGLKTIELLDSTKGEAVGSAVAPAILSNVKGATSLLELYFSVGALATLKKQQRSDVSDHAFATAVSNVLSKIKALGAGDGTWLYSEGDSDSSAKAAGLAFEATAGVIEIAGLESHRSEVRSIKAAASKLLENIRSYDDGSQYFDESAADKLTGDGGGAMGASAVVLRGISALASVLPNGINGQEEKIFGLARFFLSVGATHSSTEAYYQLDALSILEDNRLLVPLAVYLPTSVLSLTSNHQLEVAVTSVLGSPVSGVVVKLLTAHQVGKEKSPVATNQELRAVGSGDKYTFDVLAKIKSPHLGKFDLKLEVEPVPSEDRPKYSAGGVTGASIVITGAVSVLNVELAILDSDTGSLESVSKVDFAKKNVATVSANHKQKLQLSFELEAPGDGPFQPQQVFLRSIHESGLEHLYVIKPSGTHFDLSLDFLSLVEQLYYLSGTYTFELIVGDASMENSFLWNLGSLDLDLPEAPEGAAKPPAVAVDISSRYGPKPEISHTFRTPEKRPAPQLSIVFLVLTLLPLIGFIVGLAIVHANVKNFPTSGFHLLAAVGFHLGIAAILILYFFFWLKLNLFTTLKADLFLGSFTSLAGYFILSHLDNLSSRVKTA